MGFLGLFFSCFYGGKAPTRLFVVLVVPVKPFANEVANHACHNSNKKGNSNFHPNTSSSCQGVVGQQSQGFSNLGILL